MPTAPNVLVGAGALDDAGVYLLSESLALVQTIDFLTPIVADPYTFGQIAAANALSDVYAMGGEPLTAMNVVCFPMRDRGPAELIEIMQGSADKVLESGAVLLGGHSVEDAEPKFGLSVTGTVDAACVAASAGGQVGDLVILTKPLGTGIITTAAKRSMRVDVALHTACESMTSLNAGAARAMRTLGIGPQSPVHAATDITGFGLLGHLLQVAVASEVTIEINASTVPLLPDTEPLASNGICTGGSRSNLAYVEPNLLFRRAVPSSCLDALLDPQTSGGLAIFVAADSGPRLLEELEQEGVKTRAVIGHVERSCGRSLALS